MGKQFEKKINGKEYTLHIMYNIIIYTLYHDIHKI